MFSSTMDENGILDTQLSLYPDGSTEMLTLHFAYNPLIMRAFLCFCNALFGKGKYRFFDGIRAIRFSVTMISYFRMNSRIFPRNEKGLS